MKIQYFLNTSILSQHYKTKNTSFEKEIVNNTTISPQQKAYNVLGAYLSCNENNFNNMDIENMRVSLWLLDEGITPNVRTRNIKPLVDKIKQDKHSIKGILITKLNEYLSHQVI
jgi:hypothetical protein